MSSTQLEEMETDMQIRYCSEILKLAANIDHDELRNTITTIISGHRHSLQNTTEV